MFEYGRMYFSISHKGYMLETAEEIAQIEVKGGYLDALNKMSNLGWELVCVGKTAPDNREYFLRRKI